MNSMTISDLTPASLHWLNERNLEARINASGNLVAHPRPTGRQTASVLFHNVEHLNSWAESTQHMSQK